MKGRGRHHHSCRQGVQPLNQQWKDPWREHRAHKKQQKHAEDFLHGLQVMIEESQIPGRITGVKGLEFDQDVVRTHNARVRVQARDKRSAWWVRWQSIRPMEAMRCRQAHVPSFDCEGYEQHCHYTCVDDWCVHPSRKGVPCDAKSCSWEIKNAIPNYRTGRCSKIL